MKKRKKKLKDKPQKPTRNNPQPKQERKSRLQTANYLTILFPGRFQPFHNAHFLLLKKLLKRFNVTVVIGSSDLHDKDNPFTASQRKEMIQACFPEKKLKFAEVPFAPDKTWVRTLFEQVPRSSFDLVFSNNPRVQKQLRKVGIPCICGSMLRRNFLEGRRIRQWPKNWKKAVPKKVVRLIEKTRKQLWPSLKIRRRNSQGRLSTKRLESLAKLSRFGIITRGVTANQESNPTK